MSQKSLLSSSIQADSYSNLPNDKSTVPAVGLIPAAGMARRLDIDTPKELILVHNKAVIEYGIDHLVEAGIQHVVIVIRKGKEAIRDHVQQRYPHLAVQFLYQTGPIGNLLHGIQAAYQAIRNRTVYFCMADVVMSPNPFLLKPNNELLLLCQSVSDSQWRHLGVVDPIQHRIVDKPDHFISNICWGGLIWSPSFTERLMRSQDLTRAMNDSDWTHVLTIEQYIDIGIDQSQIQPFTWSAASTESAVENAGAERMVHYEFIG